MKATKGYKSASVAKRRLLCVVGDEVLTKGRMDNEKTKVTASGNTSNGWSSLNRLFVKSRMAE
jgi:hypothetical protein